MKRTKRQKMAMALAICLAAMILLSVFIGAIAPLVGATGKVTQADINKRKEDAKTLAAQKKALQEELKVLKAEKANAFEVKGTLDAQIELIEMEIENNNLLSVDISLRLAEQQAELEGALEREAIAEQMFRTRIRAMEETGETSYLAILFGSKSFLDLIGRMEMISEIVEADRKVIANLADARAEIEEAKALMEADKADLFTISKELVASEAELAAEYIASDEYIAELNKNTAEMELAYAEMDKAQQEADNEIIKLQNELKKQQEKAKVPTQYVGGEYLWPLPGYTYISSGFSNRTDPKTKTIKHHNGLDIPAPKGTKIVAANDGVVLQAAYNAGNGNYVGLDHGGGKVTMYLHMSKLGVKAGQSVKKGDVIGYVGSTGNSTGNHLHFETWENGTKYDPLKYFKVK